MGGTKSFKRGWKQRHANSLQYPSEEIKGQAEMSRVTLRCNPREKVCCYFQGRSRGGFPRHTRVSGLIASWVPSSRKSQRRAKRWFWVHRARHCGKRASRIARRPLNHEDPYRRRGTMDNKALACSMELLLTWGTAPAAENVTRNTRNASPLMSLSSLDEI